MIFRKHLGIWHLVGDSGSFKSFLMTRLLRGELKALTHLLRRGLKALTRLLRRDLKL